MMPDTNLMVDVAVVGAGPAGLAAAVELHRLGISAAVMDMQPLPGGQYYRFPAHPQVDKRSLFQETPIQDFLKATHTYLPGTTVWGIFKDQAGFLLCLDGEGDIPRRTHARKLILAPGSYESAHPFPGWTLPGVITAGAARSLLFSHGVLPGERIILCGNAPHLFLLAKEMLASGARIAALILESSFPHPRLKDMLTAAGKPDFLYQLLEIWQALKNAGIPVHWNTCIESASGSRALMRATFVSDKGRGSPFSINADTLCLGYDLLPSSQLSIQAGCSHTYSSETSVPIPMVNQNLESSLPGLFIAGDAGGISGKNAALNAGRLAALNAGIQLGRNIEKPSFAVLRKKLSAEKNNWQWLKSFFPPGDNNFSNLPDETILCRCEQVSFGQVRQAVGDGALTVNAVRQLTRAGMGRCQGRLCGSIIAGVIAGITGKEPSASGFITPRPPVFPVRASHLVNCEMEELNPAGDG